MASEITVNLFYQLTNLLTTRRQVPSTQFDQAAVGSMSNSVDVPNNSDLELELGGITTPGLAYFQNLADPETDPTHVISIGPDDTGMLPFVRLAPGQFCILFLAAAPFARAAAGTPKLFYEIAQR